jgi:hypothetical protein
MSDEQRLVGVAGVVDLMQWIIDGARLPDVLGSYVLAKETLTKQQSYEDEPKVYPRT